MGKKTSAAAASKISAVASPAHSSATASAQKSSILKSAFTPSNFQLRLFASVIQSFESQQLRIHDTTNSRLRCQHAARPGTKINSLDWGYYGTSYREAQTAKKRKRSHTDGRNAVVAYGTSDAEICMFSPAEGVVVGKLVGGHERGIYDFRFSYGNYLEGWSLGGDGNLVQWDLIKDQAVRSIPLPDPAVHTITPHWPTSPQILCASSTPFTVNIDEQNDIQIEPFDSFKNPVHVLHRSGNDVQSTPEFFLAADRDRYINVYDIGQKRLVRTLVVGSEVEAADVFGVTAGKENSFAQQMLAVITKSGTVELFAQPFLQPTRVNGDLKSSRKSLTRKASAQVKLTSADAKGRAVSIFAASLQGPELLVASVDGGIDLVFQKVRWQDEGTGDLLFDGIKEVTRLRNASTLNTASVNGVKDVAKSHVDESRTVVVDGVEEPGSQGAAIDISSSEEDEDGENESDDENEDPHNDLAEVSENDESDEEMADVIDDTAREIKTNDNEATDDEAAEEEPTFGELVASRGQTAISIAAAFEQEPMAMAVSDGAQMAQLSGMSLGTVLTQSLRTNDRNLLESCLHTTDVDIVRNTIQRLDSSLAANLLTKLAERLSTRPGRYGHLLTWVQWTCVAHGGAIAAQPAITSKLKTLYQVLGQRSRSLENLMLLKGKLDMLDAQLTYRKQLQAQRGLKSSGRDEAGMIYIEGQDDTWSSDADSEQAMGRASQVKTKPRKRSMKTLDELVGEEESDNEDMPLANGFSDSDDSEEQEDDGSNLKGELRGRKSGGLVDFEAEVSGEDEHDSGEEEDVGEGLSSDGESGEEEEDSEMDSFINDGSISEVEDEDDVEIDEDESVQKPATKRSKHR